LLFLLSGKKYFSADTSQFTGHRRSFSICDLFLEDRECPGNWNDIWDCVGGMRINPFDRCQHLVG